MSDALVIEQIWRFPLKSAQGESIPESMVDERGLRGDRQWGVLDVGSGTILTARRCPELLFVSARYHDGTDELEVILPAGQHDLGAYLGRDVQLVRAGTRGPGRYEIATDFEHEDTSPWVSWQGPDRSYHDSTKTALSVLSRRSMQDWDIRRFRANLVTGGRGEMDLVGATVRVGTVEATAPKLIDRCVMVTRAQPGIERDLDVLRAIHRTHAGDLGLALSVTRPGRIGLGDTVEVLAAASSGQQEIV
jgi:uncharacterized protein YcbX